MKKVITLTMLLGVINSYAQWGGSTLQTGDIYRSGNVGLGSVTTPGAQLHIRNTGATQLFLERLQGFGQDNGLKIFFTSSPAAGISLGAGSTIFQPLNSTGVSDMLFMRSTTQAGFILTSAGNFGIGTTSPSSKLTIYDANNTTAGQQIRIGQASGLDYTINRNPVSGYLDFLGNQLNYVGYTFMGGNMGIGTTTPQASTRLQVNGNALFALGTGAPTSSAYIRGNNNFSIASTPDYTWWNNDQTGIFHPASDVVGFTVAGTERMRVTSSGIVIGDPTQTPIPAGNQYKLYVQTGILTEKVKVALTTSLDWSDYVFASDYKLNTLENVENYVKKNKHLPGVPSADEVVKEGIDLGKMDAKLLEKIEELTLYVIELNKQNKELTERLNKLESNK